MGDRESIPRTFAPDIGVADTLPSLRRHYIDLFNGQFTTGVVWPGGVLGVGTTIQPTNGIRMFPRNFQAERAFLVAYTQGTTDQSTTTLIVDIMGGGTTIARLQGNLNLFWGFATTTMAGVMSTTPLNPNVAATQPIRVQVVQKINLANFGSVFLVGQERLD